MCIRDRYRDRECDDLRGEDSFLMEDPTFNALWARSEFSLASIAEAIGRDPAPHRVRAAELTAALGGLYDEELGLFVARDVIDDTLVRKATISGVVPLILPGLSQACLLYTSPSPR